MSNWFNFIVTLTDSWQALQHFEAISSTVIDEQPGVQSQTNTLHDTKKRWSIYVYAMKW